MKWSVVAVRKRYMYILAALLAAVLATLVCGCVEKYGYRDINEGALEHMEKKYREKFEFVRSHGLFYSKNSRSIMVSCESFPGEVIRVDIIQKGKREIYYDNYMRYHFAEQVNEYITDIAKNYFDEVTFAISISAITIDPEIDLRTTFEEYLFERNYSVYGSMKVGETNEDTMREFAEELVRRGIQFTIGINIPPTDEGYDIRYRHDFKEIDFYRRK